MALSVRSEHPPCFVPIALIVWCGACTCNPALAADEPSPTPPPQDVDQVLESARQSVRSTSEWLARGVDSWFGDKPFSDGGKVSDGRLSMYLLTRQHQSPDFAVRFNARFRLPNVESRAYLFFGRDDQRDVVTDTPDSFSRQQRLQPENTADNSFFGGIGLPLHDNVQFRLGLRGGLKPYAQARYGQRWRIGAADLVDFRETLFWSLADHVGSTTALSYEHAYSSTLAVRWLGSTTITQVSKHFDWSSSIGAYKSFGDSRLLSLEALVSGTRSAGIGVSDFGLQTKWSQPVHKDWLIGEVLVGHFWPRQDALSPRLRAWALGLGVKMLF